MSFVRRIINLQFKLGKGAFGADGSDTVTLTGVRCSASIRKEGGASMAHLELRAYGIPLDIMNKLTILNILRQNDARFNQVTVSAGDEINGVSVAFSGNMTAAWIDGSGAPDVAFIVSAAAGYVEALRPVPPVSYKGAVDVATVIAGIGAQMNPVRTLENSGVNIQIRDPYLTGTLMDQLRTIARAANINCLLDDGPADPSQPNAGAVIAIWPSGGSRDGQIALVSPQTGLVGYPALSQSGLHLMTIYNPSLAFGRTIEVKSMFEPANGKWVISNIGHDLESETPGGKWFTTVDSSLIGQALSIVG